MKKSNQIDWSLFDNPAPLINMASRSLARLGERNVKPFGFSIGQMPVLYLLRDGSSMTQKDLAQGAKIEQPSMAQMLARMERDGLIQRELDPKDGRSSLVSLSKNTLAKLPLVHKAMKSANEHFFSDFSAEELRSFVQMLQRFNAKLDSLVAEDNA